MLSKPLLSKDEILITKFVNVLHDVYRLDRIGSMLQCRVI